MMFGVEYWPGPWMPLIGLGMLFFWGAAMGLAVWGIRFYGRPSGSWRSLEIAELRYARGEITLRELENIKTALG